MSNHGNNRRDRQRAKKLEHSAEKAKSDAVEAPSDEGRGQPAPIVGALVDAGDMAKLKRLLGCAGILSENAIRQSVQQQWQDSIQPTKQQKEQAAKQGIELQDTTPRDRRGAFSNLVKLGRALADVDKHTLHLHLNRADSPTPQHLMPEAGIDEDFMETYNRLVEHGHLEPLEATTYGKTTNDQELEGGRSQSENA